jgi:hypothetical protein
MSEPNSTLNARRGFVKAVGVAGSLGLGLALGRPAEAATIGPQTAVARRNQARDIRRDISTANHSAAPNALQSTNGDEEALANRIGNFSKGLAHNSEGEVVLASYNALVAALTTGTHAALETVPLGGARKLNNPQAGIAFEMEGADSPTFLIPPPPTFSSRQAAAEISENYWMALLRDVPFASYSSNAIAASAVADLNLYGADLGAPKNGSGLVTPELLFRGLTPGDAVGPYLSQFFYLPCPMGANNVSQLVQCPTPGINFMTDFSSFLNVQNGASASGATLQSVPRYMQTGRDQAGFTNRDVVFQAYFMAFLVLQALNAPLDAGNPYASSLTQAGGGTFGRPHVVSLLGEVAARATRAAYYQKWFAHRRLRPEAYAGAAHARLYRGGSAASFPVHADILTSLGTSTRLGGQLPAGNALLPMGFPEGAPIHPAYLSGHATIAGACATVLKAFFDENWAIPAPVQPSADGLSLESFSGTLTVGGELNKLASNVGLARNQAGDHWRSDTTQSLLLGEALALKLLAEQKGTYNEPQPGMSLTRFDGSIVTV